MGKHSKKEINIKLIVVTILVFILIICGAYIGWYIIQHNNNQKDVSIISTIQIDETKITAEKTERMLQLEELQKENNQIKAYIEIPGTGISYPVLQAEDNDYYMNRDYKKQYGLNGSLFLDKDVNLNLPSSNFLIYGHNNENGMMFSNLLNYNDENYYKEHQTIRFTTNSEDSEYEIIAVFLSRVYYKSERNVFRYYYFINAQTQQEFDEYVTNSKKSSIYDTGKTAQYGDQLITLSTCSGHTEDGRLAVVARRIK